MIVNYLYIANHQNYLLCGRETYWQWKWRIGDKCLRDSWYYDKYFHNYYLSLDKISICQTYILRHKAKNRIIRNKLIFYLIWDRATMNGGCPLLLHCINDHIDMPSEFSKWYYPKLLEYASQKGYLTLVQSAVKHTRVKWYHLKYAIQNHHVDVAHYLSKMYLQRKKNTIHKLLSKMEHNLSYKMEYN